LVSKRWTSEEEDFLRANYNKMSNKELAEKFNVTTISIQRKLSRLNLIRQVQKKWTEKEEKYLRENYQEFSDAQLSKKFNVTPIAIKRKLNRLGLRRGQRKRTVKKNVEKVVLKKEVKEKTVQPITKLKKPSSNSFIKYSINKEYNAGDLIYHEIFKDKGKIVDKDRSDEGLSLIVVDFEKSGVKILVENIEPN